MRTDLLVDRRRLCDLAERLELGEVTEALTELEGVEPAQQKPQVQTAGKRLLRELATRRNSRPPPLPGAGERWDRLAPLLAGVESMSRRELGQIDAAMRRARDEALAKVETLPAGWRARCRTALAGALVSPDSLDTSGVDAVAARLQRRLSAGIAAVCRNVGRQIHQDLLRHVAATLDTLYPLAATCDQILRTMEHGPFGGDGGSQRDAPEAPSLVARLSERRQAAARRPDAGPEDAETAARLGALASALGAETFPAALETLRSTESPPLPPAGAEGTAEAIDEPRHERLRNAVLETARFAVGRAWESRRHSIVEAVSGHVAERFAALQREIDGWLDEARRRLAALCGQPGEADEQLDAIRFEVLDICRRFEETEV